MDGRKIGLPDVRETLGIRPKCVWAFPCMEDKNICGVNEPNEKYPMCVQKGTQGFECRCRDGVCGGSGGRRPEQEEWDQVRI